MEETLTQSQEWPIAATKLTKVYKNGLLAVSNNTFGVKAGETLGLLGPNGAGKSTTFSMLAMEQSMTSGNVRLMGQELQSVDLIKEGSKLGMCPQYNAIWEQLTVRENLQFIARCKGLTQAQFENNLNVIVETLNLLEYLDVKAEFLSGGNKRKLSCALTLLVHPTIEFLDEPTTGVDPVSRRNLFRMIKQLKDSSIVLTTHRMDEAEQLCDNIAIMVNGSVVCYGTPTYLMEEYGGGYEFTIVNDVRNNNPDQTF